MTMDPPHGSADNEKSERRFRFRKHGSALALAVCALALFAYLAQLFVNGTMSGAAQKEKPPQFRRVPVSAVAAGKGDIGVYLNALGTVTPHYTVQVKTRVDGQLMNVRFREGQIVASGELLAEIDPRPFEAQLLQAEGQLARDQALLANAKVDLGRYRLLLEQDSIARQQYDAQHSLVRQYEGVVQLDRGLVDNARLQLSYARIVAPISGRAGLRTVDPGTIVHATDTVGLVTIAQLQPISVIFPIPEDSIPQVVEGLKAGRRLPVDAYDRQQTRKLATGTLLTIDNQIDPATGTVRCKAEFANTGNELFPNQFVNARLLLEVKRGVVLVPAVAVQRSPQGPYVYVVGNDGIAAMRMVKIGVSHEDVASVEQGVSPGERVVVSGVERLREGTPVEVVSKGKGTAKSKK